jgi:hypothetical protein
MEDGDFGDEVLARGVMDKIFLWIVNAGNKMR